MRKFLKIIIGIIIIVLVLFLLTFIYLCTGNYKPEKEALKYLNSDDNVTVSEIKEGYFFDGKGIDTAVVFYPGAKVDYKSYAKLMYMIAENGYDCFLLKMPFNMAIFNVNKADKILDKYNYDNWYVAGHSMGGAMACNYACSHSDNLKGVIALAGYPTKTIPDNLELYLIYGSEDKILSMDVYNESRKYYPTNAKELVIQGGNHAGFANYGEQKKDGKATISTEEQQRKTIEFIFKNKMSVEKNEEINIKEKMESFFKENEDAEKIGDEEKIELIDTDGKGIHYTFSYSGETFKAEYSKDNWKIIDSYKINNKKDIYKICEALILIHPIHGLDNNSYRTAEDMTYEWIQHNVAYQLLPEDNKWKENTKDVDLDSNDQGKSLLELYEDRTNQKFDINSILN